ncbi:hypothetical protein COW36_12385 [bacterium (Candidatus Blackallbacteria) CG17_big_fil_post_rev_8_21_14_2_50_48_46]|uniref:DUF3326 domain-containing protein n=1 Tax=bacterium (Candidatus Blackallbacteria) CG17_big_fil_post_rev_8_21_14_2_50_48_46 TaxID=2014261 RepID=A0A2M7G3U9_9BACT|nr:MAG: hypothetical protein COW64_02875 [bacterium (Candidatus Blackallbacteria) CG18_big_fil_WC_8_21_14_2_50_49_26]PIW16558.1 MAG: hypothetical protein COW36_12385 [bacterium (Candidatus Blackallbacteria) CG17_big_fil_post_rev_8_21_14_2_50_48_46]PIW46066.1 MAG: hypothetical protein COW20_17650 [bacterium (Candidatus Blackallbacteria) CG13_big_fil_rev_8_21_14_2_50_49_14]
MFSFAFIVPTGIGAAVGGYAGDAGIVVRYLASLADCVLTHPNAVNAAMFYEQPPQVRYLEGTYLDAFFQRELGFKKQAKQSIGLVIDRACEPYLPILENVVHATAMSTGCTLKGYTLTSEPVALHFEPHAYGYSGTVENLEVLSAAAHRCLAQGATALAILTWMDILEPGVGDDYLQGKGVDPIGTLEALISHALARELQVPLAHSPIFAPEIISERLDPRVAAEEIGLSYLPCVLKGLHHAPAIVPYTDSEIKLEDLDAVLAPWNAVGGLPMLRAVEEGIPLILVKENQSDLKITPEILGFAPEAYFLVENYWEAAGLLLALKEGIDPRVLRRPLSPLLQQI